MSLYWKSIWAKVIKFFLGVSAMDMQRVERLEQAVIALQAQFKYLQQRVDKMEVPR